MSTLTTIAATDIISASRSVINANFATLNNDKVDIAGVYADPSWLTSISGAKVTGAIAGNAATATKLATSEHPLKFANPAFALKVGIVQTILQLAERFPSRALAKELAALEKATAAVEAKRKALAALALGDTSNQQPIPLDGTTTTITQSTTAP